VWECRDHQSQQFVGQDLPSPVLPHPLLGARQYAIHSWDFIIVIIKVRFCDYGIGPLTVAWGIFLVHLTVLSDLETEMLLAVEGLT
jgi:hypothetical protein